MKDVFLSIIIPVYNEINTVLELIRQVQEEPHPKEIIIVDDASTDGSREALSSLNAANLKVIFNDFNRGKGYCIRQAIPYVKGDIVIIQDADLEYYPDEYGTLIAKILEGKADVVYGTRFLGAHRVFLFYHYIGNSILNTIANILLNVNLTDFMTCYKAFRAPVLKELTLKAERFGIEAEITAEIIRRQKRLYEVPISYNGRTYQEGKKITWIDFFRCLYWLFRARARCIDLAQETLMRMQFMTNNNTWIYNKIRPYLGKNILEVGAGIGTISRFLLARDSKLTVSDIDKASLSILENRFKHNPRITIVKADCRSIDEVLPQRSFDAIVNLNVLEHIDDDRGALARLKKLLTDEGRLILLVPAHQALFSPLDRQIGHLRRYSKKDLRALIEGQGFVIEYLSFMDALGAIGWFVNFKVFRRKRMPLLTTRCFDAVIPFLAFLERYIPLPFGLSLLCIAKPAKTLLQS